MRIIYPLYVENARTFLGYARKHHPRKNDAHFPFPLAKTSMISSKSKKNKKEVTRSFLAASLFASR